MKPPFPYSGGKTRVAQRIAALLPPHQNYVEPFFGAGAVLLAKPPSKVETVNDLDGQITNFWRVLREQPENLIRACALTPHAHAEYVDCRDHLDTGDAVERARRLFCVQTQAFAARKANHSGWRRQFVTGGGTPVPEYLAGYVDRLAGIAERIQHVSIENMDALDFIKMYGVSPQVLVYADPPYMDSARGPTQQYTHEMTDPARHETLIGLLGEIPAQVVLSGYRCGLYDSLLGGWERHDFPATNVTHGRRVESVWIKPDARRQTVLF